MMKPVYIVKAKLVDNPDLADFLEIEIPADNHLEAKRIARLDPRVKAIRSAKRLTLEVAWDFRTFDVWGNDHDGYEVNDVYSKGEVEMTLEVYEANPGTDRAFRTVDITDKIIRKTMGIKRAVQIETDGDDVNIYVTQSRNGYPLGELLCTSHESLSPIKEKKDGNA